MCQIARLSKFYELFMPFKLSNPQYTLVSLIFVSLDEVKYQKKVLINIKDKFTLLILAMRVLTHRYNSKIVKS